MELIAIFKQVKCPVLKYGLKKIAMDYYYCRSCDKDNKFPLCHNCLTRCHKGHQGSERKKASSENLICCTCAMNNHQILSQDEKFAWNSLSTCFFYELNKVTDNCFCFENKNKKKICNFCYYFCKQNSPDEKEFQSEFTKIKIDNVNFKCKCPSFKNSKHTAVDIMSRNLSEINKSTQDYFPNTNNVILTNLYFGSDELFRSVNKKFLSVFNQLILEHGDRYNYASATREELYIKIPSIVIHTYNIFRKNALNCAKETILFFIKDINNYFNEKVFNFFVENCLIGIKKAFRNYNLEENFYESFLYGFKIFNIYSYHFRISLPKYKINEFICLTPYQRLLLKHNNKLINHYDFKKLVNFVKEFNKVNQTLLSTKITIQILSIFKKFASLYIFNKEQINDFLISECIYFESLENCWEHIIDKTDLLKLFNIVCKLLIYFSLYYNDVCVMENLYNIFQAYKKDIPNNITNNNSTMGGTPVQIHNIFAFSDNEITRNITKCIIHITRFIQLEYNEYTRFNLKQRKYYSGIMNKLHLLLRLGFLKNDYYDLGLKMLIDNYDIECMAFLLYNNLPKEKLMIINSLDKEEKEINFKLNEFYTSSKDIKKIINKFAKSLNIVLSLLGINKSAANRQKLDKNLKDKNDLSSISSKDNNTDNNKEGKDNSPKRNIEKKNSRKIIDEKKEKDIKKKKELIISKEIDFNNNNIKFLSFGNYFISLTNIFHITKNTNLFSQDFCESIIFLYSKCIEASCENFYYFVNKQIISNLINMPWEYQPKIISIIKKGFKKLVENNYGDGNNFELINTLNNIYINNKLIKDALTNYICIKKLLKIYLIISKASSSKKEYIRFIKKQLMKNVEIKKIINNYIKYLLKVSDDFLINKQNYLTHKTFNNKKIFKLFFSESIPHKVIYEIFITYIELIMYNKENILFNSNITSIREDFPAKNIETILTITTLDFKLRTNLITLFLLLYINAIIDEKKLNLYRTQFQLNMDENLNETLLSTIRTKYFKFYHMLLSINSHSIIEEEYNVLINEIKNFNEIINYANIKSEEELKYYYEYGILLPLNVYLNKVFSLINEYKGNDLLKLYSFTCNTLLMIKQFSNKLLIIKVSNDNNDRNEALIESSSIFKTTNKEKTLKPNQTVQKLSKRNSIKVKSRFIMKIDEYLGILTSLHSCPLNYSTQYNILSETVLNYFYEKSKSKNTTMKEDKEKKETKDNPSLNKQKESNLYISSLLNELYEIYLTNKKNYMNSSYKSVLDLNYNSNENTYRKILVKYLLNLIVEEISIYDEESTEILKILLSNESESTQNSIMLLLNQKEFSKLNIIIEKCFITILNSVLSLYNPSYVLINNFDINYISSINLFQLMCEGHNNYFQKIFLKQFYFSLNDIQKIGFYDLMLFILEKIIIISGWNLYDDTKDDEINYNFINLFEKIIYMLIEIIQGTEDKNFYSLINQKLESGQKRLINHDRMDPVLQKGKAFESFLKCVRNLITKDCKNLSNFNKIRKILMDFLLAFMEEYQCPIEIKLMIIVNFHSSQIIRSIAQILKNIYISRKGMDNKENATDIYLTDEMEQYFLKLYLSEENLFQDSNFQLCCSFYNYFKITLLECKDEDALSFWSKIHSLLEENLASYNAGVSNKTFNSDASDFEAYYVIKLFENISKSVLVKIKEDKIPMFVIYSKPPCLNYLSEQTKTNFLNTVNRKNRSTKLIELMEQSEYFKIEVEYNFNKLRNRDLMKKLCWIDYYPFKIFIFIVDLILNFYYLEVVESNGDKDNQMYHYNIIRVLSFIFCLIVFIAFIIWTMTKMKLALELEKVKYMEQEKITDDKTLTWGDSLKLFFLAYFSKGEFNTLFIFLIFNIIGSIKMSFSFVYCFSLLALLGLSNTLYNLVETLISKGRQIIWVAIFMFIIVYVYSGWGFYYLNDRFYDEDDREPENMCDSLFYCFLTLTNNGLRWYPGVGKILRVDSPFLHLSQYIHNYIYHFTFYFIIRVIMLKIVLGIILDSFNELREKKSNIEKDRKFRCFICNIEKNECEKKNKDFNEHCVKEHNLWDYANYMIMLRMSEFEDLNGVNSKCKEMILERQIKWIPDNEL